jgi:predicted deacylase
MKISYKKIINTILFMVLFYLCIEVISWILFNLIPDNKCDLVTKYEFKGSKKGKTLLIIGSVHGNEPAGHFALMKLKKQLNNNQIKIKRGKLIIIPTPNYCGLQYDYRHRPGFIDINRSFPTIKNGRSGSINNKLIVKYIKESKPDFILDFHEAFYFHRRNPTSLGSYLIINKECSSEVKRVAHKCKLNVNKIVKEYYKKWDITNNIPTEEGSLRYYAKLNNIDYLLIETVGQRKMEKIQTRIKINLNIIKMVMKLFNMI